ncbi:MAG: DUF29 domain-containing protein [Kamptonema sp. SIO4C4]|nr:DUF29 domain-containing protein [Kamptonema sp. SIO4C4]
MNSMINSQQLYNKDFVEWCKMTTSQLKERNFKHLDIDNLIEEIESLAKRERRELKSRLTVLLAHLLKRIYVNSPENFNGWELTIREQRRQIQDLLNDSPSLNSYLGEILDTVYRDALDDVRFEYKQTEFPDIWEFDLESNALLSEKYWEET